MDALPAPDFDIEGILPEQSLRTIAEINAPGRNQQFPVVQPRIVEIQFQSTRSGLFETQFAQSPSVFPDNLRMLSLQSRGGPFTVVLRLLPHGTGQFGLVPFAPPGTFFLSFTHLLRLSAGQPQSGLFSLDLPV